MSLWKQPRDLKMLKLLIICTLLISGVSAYGFGQNISGPIRQWATQERSIQKLGKYLIQVDSVKRIYEINQYQPIWVQGKRLSSAALEFVEVLKNPNEFGFFKTDFIDPQLDQLLLKADKNASNLFWLEILLTDKWIQMSKYLYKGRLADYYILDDDTKLPNKTFERWDELASILSSLHSADQVRPSLQKMEPKNRIYKSLKQALVKILKAEAAQTWKTLTLPKEKIAVGGSHEFIRDLKIQMTHYGYSIATIDSNYDDNLVKQIALFHKYNKTAERGLSGNLVKFLSIGLDLRKEKLFVAMEKARMLPDEFELNYIYVNVALQEFKLFENGQLVIEMKTINGQKFRRTPTMRDLVTVVELNPTWTVPPSIAIKDKLPEIKKDPGYLARKNMILYDYSNQPVDPYLIDWSLVVGDGKGDKEKLRADPSYYNFNSKYYIRQGPGHDNALGLVKFPLTNPWAIYLHDTDNRSLFSQENRLISSGCVRLEKPFVLVDYLLRDQPGYESDVIQRIVNTGLSLGNESLPTRIKTKTSLPVYTSFITADVTADGVVRFMDDVYGSDLRLLGILKSQDSALTSDADEIRPPEVTNPLAAIAENKAIVGFLGNLTDTHVSKIVKLYKCVKNKRNSCQLKYALDFNKNYLVDVGDYIAIFENQIHAEILSLVAKTPKLIKMVDLELPDVFEADTRVRIFHDLDSGVEQKRILMESFYFAKSPLKFSQYDFGDYYLSSLGMKVMNERVDYGLCLTGSGYSPEAADICRIYRSANSPEGLRGLFVFGAPSLSAKYSDGEFSQKWLSKPGDRFVISHKRRLLAAPLASKESILVFPGAYKARGDQSAKTVTIKADAVN